MSKIAKTAITIIVISVFAFILYIQFITNKYEPADDEIALNIQLNIKEDIGLIVFDYVADGHEYSGGISNADKSLIGHNSNLIIVWNTQELNSSSYCAEITIKFRIITEYTPPNYENIYPRNITAYVDTPISWKADFGKEYFITISGDKISGYTAELIE